MPNLESQKETGQDEPFPWNKPQQIGNLRVLETCPRINLVCTSHGDEIECVAEFLDLPMFVSSLVGVSKGYIVLKLFGSVCGCNVMKGDRQIRDCF